MLPESYLELDRLVQFMASQANLKIRLEGHTDITLCFVVFPADR